MSFNALEQSVRRALTAREAPTRVVLAVSGGADSMVLLHAAARVAPKRVAAVATFDHGTGKYARDAAALVMAQASELGMRVAIARASRVLKGETEWRAARWEFLRSTAQQLLAGVAPVQASPRKTVAAPVASAAISVATAHTRDDQVETVAMRVLRGSGARGLAGLYSRSEIVRPLIAHTRAEILGYAARHSIPFLEDPSNLSRSFLRNRLRLDILPGLRTVNPGIEEVLLDLAHRAAHWRDDVDSLVDSLGITPVDERVSFERDVIAGLCEEELRVLVPAIAARAGVRLDRRGTALLASFLLQGGTRGRIQLSGGHEVERAGGIVRFSRMRPEPAAEAPLVDVDQRWGEWLFRTMEAEPGFTPWCAWLPVRRKITVRAWTDGDRMIASGSTSPRRVKRFLSDAGVAGADRTGWPVVLADETIIWIPGVRRAADAEPDRSGSPTETRILYVCERFSR
jgi:tRNA(Ile)-lysidine synthase